MISRPHSQTKVSSVSLTRGSAPSQLPSSEPMLVRGVRAGLAIYRGSLLFFILLWKRTLKKNVSSKDWPVNCDRDADDEDIEAENTEHDDDEQEGEVNSVKWELLGNAFYCSYTHNIRMHVNIWRIYTLILWNFETKHNLPFSPGSLTLQSVSIISRPLPSPQSSQIV